MGSRRRARVDIGLRTSSSVREHRFILAGASPDRTSRRCVRGGLSLAGLSLSEVFSLFRSLKWPLDRAQLATGSPSSWGETTVDRPM